MKKSLLFFTAFLILSLSSFAQNDIQFNIHHKLGDGPFVMNSTTTNNLNNTYQFNRLDYYISEISIVHDGGIETKMEDLWVFVSTRQTTEVELGNHNINEVEGVNLHIGVDADHNHLDPSTYDVGHPLAPKNPSMHWGWAGGYRFIAVEGHGGSDLSQLFQLHTLGDDNYFKTEVSLTAIAENGAIEINLDADYTRMLENIDVDSGVIIHGEDQEARLAVENFRDYVFSPSSLVNATVDFSEVNSLQLFPNPSDDGAATFMVEATENLTYEVTISDVLGRTIQRFNTVPSNTAIDLNLNQSGLYFVNLIKNGQTIMTKKLVSK